MPGTGRGPGGVGRYLARRGVDVIGIDLAPAMLAIAHGVHGITVSAADLRALPFKTESAAGVFAFCVLQHLPRSELQSGLREFRHVLASDGVLLVAVHAGGGQFEPAPGITATCYTEAELTSQLATASFRVQSVPGRRRRERTAPTCVRDRCASRRSSRGRT